MIADSSEYAAGEINVTVEQFHPDDIAFETPILTFVAQDTLLQDKDDNGIFYGPEYRAYHFQTPDGLDVYLGSSDELYTYRMTVTFADQRLPLTAVTTLIGSSPGNISNPPAGIPGFNLNFASGAAGQVTYPNVNFKWSSTPGAKRYEASIAVHFTERIWADAAHTNLVSETDRVVRWDLGEETADDAEGGEEIKLPVNGEAFYQFLASRLEADPLITRELGEWNNNIDRVRAFDFVLSIANQELDTYLAVNAPCHGHHSRAPSVHEHCRRLGLVGQPHAAVGRWIGHFEAIGARIGRGRAHRRAPILFASRHGGRYFRVRLSLRRPKKNPHSDVDSSLRRGIVHRGIRPNLPPCRTHSPIRRPTVSFIFRKDC